MSETPHGARRIFGSFHFLVACAILAAGAISLTVAGGDLVFAKAEVPPTEPLVAFPERIGARYELATFIDGGSVERGKARLTADVVKTLGTEEFISWYFVDKARSTLRSRAYVHLHLAYYTGILDAVPHVPERCQLAAGMQADPSNTRSIEWSLDDPPATWESWSNFDVRQAGFSRTQRDGSVSRSVTFYFFVANGEPALREGVIAEMSKPWKKYCYFMKVELSAGRTDRAIDAAEAEQLCREFFAAAAGDIFEHVLSNEQIEALEAGRR